MGDKTILPQKRKQDDSNVSTVDNNYKQLIPINIDPRSNIFITGSSQITTASQAKILPAGELPKQQVIQRVFLIPFNANGEDPGITMIRENSEKLYKELDQLKNATLPEDPRQKKLVRQKMAELMGALLQLYDLALELKKLVGIPQ